MKPRTRKGTKNLWFGIKCITIPCGQTTRSRHEERRLIRQLYMMREDYRSFEREIRINYYRGTRMTFRDFLHKCESILDKLDWSSLISHPTLWSEVTRGFLDPSTPWRTNLETPYAMQSCPSRQEESAFDAKYPSWSCPSQVPDEEIPTRRSLDYPHTWTELVHDLFLVHVQVLLKWLKGLMTWDVLDLPEWPSLPI